MRNKIRRALRNWSFRLKGGTRYGHRIYHPIMLEALAGCQAQSDISDHLGTIFFFALDAKPKLIVELGTRGGESTRVLLAAAQMSDATVLSIDIDDVSQINLPFRDRWQFIRDDDVEFGRSKFAAWCASRDLPPQADVIFIDTSHLYEHTRQELATWAPHLSTAGTMMFHDTNMGQGAFSRLDGSIGIGWNNQRGVIKAVEEFLGRRYEENRFFDDVAAGFLVRHYPNCSGLTVLKKTHLQ